MLTVSMSVYLSHLLASTTANLPGIFQTAEPILDKYGYFAVGFLILIEDFGLPVPGETVLVAAALYAGAGRLDIAVIVPVAIVAAVIGDNIGFVIGHYGGDQLIKRYGKYVFLTAERFASARKFFQRFGGPIIMAARFIDGLRQVNGIIAGTARMSWRRFLLFNVIGAGLWVGTWATVGYLAGDNINTAYKTFTRYEALFIAAVIVFVVGFAMLHVVRNKRRRDHAKR